MEIHHENSGYSFGSSVKLYREGSTKLHWHDQFEICEIVDDSECEFIVDGTVVRAHKGDIVAFPPKSLHRFIIKTPQMKIRIIQFPFKMILNSVNSHKCLKTYIKSEEISKVPDLRNYLNMLCTMADCEEFTKVGGQNDFLEHIIVSVYFLLLRSFSASESYKSKNFKSEEMFEIVKFINDNYKNDINTKVIAEKFLHSRGRLADTFEKYAGVSIKGYIDELRLKNAISLLNAGSTVSEAAYESGFQSIRTFNSSFKKKMGITPTEFKQKNIKL